MKKNLILVMLILFLAACGSEEPENVRKGSISYDETMSYLESLTNPFVELAVIMQSNVENIYEKVHEKHQEIDDTSAELLQELKEVYEEEIDEVKELINLANTLQNMVKNKENDMSHVVEYSEMIGSIAGEISFVYLDGDFPGAFEVLLSQEGTPEEDSTEPDIKKDFFLDDSNKKLYQEKINHGQYAELNEEVKSYIDGEDVEDYDLAYEILEALEPALELLDEVEINYDEFDKFATIHYDGLKDISSENSIVPYLENVRNVRSNGEYIHILIGFEKEGWLFANTAAIKVSDEVNTFGSVNFETDTLSGGMIRESSVERWSDRHEELVQDILEAGSDDVQMRFEGKKGKLDYTFTDNDIRAIEVINTFKEVNNDLANIFYKAVEEYDI